LHLMVRLSMSTTKPNTLLTISAITNEALRVLDEEMFGAHKPSYEIRSKYGKYKVVKYYGRDYKNAEVLVRGVSKEVAEGYVKLLKEE